MWCTTLMNVKVNEWKKGTTKDSQHYCFFIFLFLFLDIHQKYCGGILPGPTQINERVPTRKFI